MQVQHSYNSSANGCTLLTHVLSLSGYGSQNNNLALTRIELSHDISNSGYARFTARPLKATGVFVHAVEEGVLRPQQWVLFSIMVRCTALYEIIFFKRVADSLFLGCD